jgi:hypothetical protein
MVSPLCSRQYASERTTMSQHAVEANTGSHSTTRDDLAEESGYDLDRLFAYVRQREREAAARGVKFAPAPTRAEPSAVVREEPPAS